MRLIAGAPKFLFEEDPAPPGGADDGGVVGASSKFASVFKASSHLLLAETAAIRFFIYPKP